MWIRKEIKKKAQKNLKKNYWLMVAICFVLAFVCNEHTTSVSAVSQNDDTEVTADSDNIVYAAKSGDNWGVVSDVLNGLETQKNFSAPRAIREMFNQFTDEHSMLFDALGAAGAGFDSEWEEALILFLAAVGATFFTVCIAWPVLVGGKRYYLDVSEGLEGLKIQILVCIFRKGVYRNTIKIMFFKWFKFTLWCFTIIGGVIKYYEYRVLPYILADNPRLKQKEVFVMAQDMMKGNKWKLFKLDMSFVGWLILTVVTLGLLGIFYVNPYQALSDTEAYVAIREEAAKRKPELYKPLLESTF